MADIKRRNVLESWLLRQPRDVAIAIAVRAALRVLPVAISDRGRPKDNEGILSAFRAVAIARISVRRYNEEAVAAAALAADAAADAADAADAAIAADAAGAAAAIAAAADLAADAADA
ncbi:MAG: hypothetical protein AAFR03_06405, partial [Pseudomonadota bacterium]